MKIYNMHNGSTVASRKTYPEFAGAASIHRMIYQSVRLLQISNQLEEQMNSNLPALFVLFHVGIQWLRVISLEW